MIFMIVECIIVLLVGRRSMIYVCNDVAAKICLKEWCASLCPRVFHNIEVEGFFIINAVRARAWKDQYYTYLHWNSTKNCNSKKSFVFDTVLFFCFADVLAKHGRAPSFPP